MKYIRQFLIILIISFIGEILHFVVPFPIPASIYGIIILFLCLQLKIITLDKIKDVGNFLIQIMPIMFVPAAVELLDSWHMISANAFKYSIIIIFSTIAVMVVSGHMTQFVLKVANKEKGKYKND